MSCGAYKLRGFLSDSCATICVLKVADTTAARTLRQACAVLIVIREIIRDVYLFSTARRTARIQTMDNKKRAANHDRPPNLQKKSHLFQRQGYELQLAVPLDLKGDL